MKIKMFMIIMEKIILIHGLENFKIKKKKQMMEKMKLIIRNHQIISKRIIKWDIIILNNGLNLTLGV